jgi:uncharacterized protein (DUF58 family)
MLKPNQKTIIKAYIIVLLIIVIIVSPLPQFALALTLLALQLYTTYKTFNPNINLTLTVVTIIFTPLTLVSLTGNILAVLFIIPIIYMLDQNLQENAFNQVSLHTKEGRNPTFTLKTLTITLAIVFLAALILSNETLLLSTTSIITYVLAVLGYNLRKIPKNPLKETKTWNRTLAGNIAHNITEVTTTSKPHLHTTLTTPEPWIQIKPAKFTATKNPQQVKQPYPPPLAGPKKLQIQATTMDTRGLIQTKQTLQPLNLHIIPKAKYAKWLAKKYLEQTTAGTASASAAPPRANRTAKYGVEYFGSRLYQPGDRLKDIDWKHTFTLGELVIKEYAGAHGQPTIIVADLTSKDAQDADKLAYNMVMAALTSATESLPAALAIYNQKEVLAATAPANPQETLKETLRITEKITITKPLLKTLRTTETRRLKRTNEEVKETHEKLAKFLEFEIETNQVTAKNHPANQALSKCTDKIPPPAIITITSPMTYDSYALEFTLEKLKEKGYSSIQTSS